jgi:hypothetical protein
MHCQFHSYFYQVFIYFVILIFLKILIYKYNEIEHCFAAMFVLLQLLQFKALLNKSTAFQNKKQKTYRVTDYRVVRGNNLINKTHNKDADKKNLLLC